MPELLKKSLDFLKLEVNNYVNATPDGIIEIVNIAALNDGDDFLESSFPIILSIVNIEEDTIARNPYLYKKKIDNSTPDKFLNPAQHLNVSILFTAYSKEQKQDTYLEGINKLEGVIRCFQQQNVFMMEGTKLILDLQSQSINELNQLWSMLGNKYMPSVLYKMRMITIQHDPVEGDQVIEKVRIKLWRNDPEDVTGQLEETNDISVNNT